MSKGMLRRTLKQGALLVGLVLAVAMAPQMARAQVPSDLPRILGVNTAPCPDVIVRVAPPLALARDQGVWTILENDRPQRILRVQPVELPLQIAFVLDVAGDISKTGASAAPVRDEFVSAISKFLLKPEALDLGPQDRLMLIVPQGETGYEIAQEWTSDPNRVYNQAYLSVNKAPPRRTALAGITVQAMARMQDVAGYEQRAKVLIVLSDGIDRTSVQDISDIINRARLLDVSILTIKVGPTAMGDAQNLRRMAEETNGTYAAYVGPEALTPLLEAVRQHRVGYDLAYRSAVASSGQQVLRVTVAAGERKLSSARYSFGLEVNPPRVTITSPAANETVRPGNVPVAIAVDFGGCERRLTTVRYLVNGAEVAVLPPTQGYIWETLRLPAGRYSLQVEVGDDLGLVGHSEPVSVDLLVQPPSVAIISPATDLQIERKARSWNSDATTIEPCTLPVVLQITYPDGLERSISSVRYLLNGAEIATQGNADPFVWDISRLPSGRYSLVAEVTDELGHVGRSNPLNLELNVTVSDWSRILLAFALVVAGVALLLAIYAYARNPQQAKAAIAEAGRRASATLTDLLGLSRDGAPPRAWLIELYDGGGQGKRHDIVAQSVVLGRSPTYANIVIDNRYVSSKHARIVEEADGQFRLWEDGGRNGTFVNGERLPLASSKPLNSGDIIMLGEVRLQFMTNTGEPGDDPGKTDVLG